MKHLSTLCLSLLLSTLLSACGSTDTAPSSTNTSQASTETNQTAPETSQDSTGSDAQEQEAPLFLSGEELTLETFAPYDITAINVWATWCGPCVNEMPDLQELYTLLPDNMNFITICQDGDTQNTLALNILSNSQAQFHSYFLDENLSNLLMPQIVAFPTTLFIDKDGNVVGDHFRGAPKSDVAQSYLKLMDNAFSLITE